MLPQRHLGTHLLPEKFKSYISDYFQANCSAFPSCALDTLPNFRGADDVQEFMPSKGKVENATNVRTPIHSPSYVCIDVFCLRQLDKRVEDIVFTMLFDGFLKSS